MRSHYVADLCYGIFSDIDDDLVIEDIHACSELKIAEPCFYSEAITDIFKIKGKWIASHYSEYGDVINWCPFCGIRLAGIS